MVILLSKNINLNDFKEYKIKLEEVEEDIIDEYYDFPKYATQIINLANSNSQGTRPKVVGQLSDLIEECPEKSLKGWKKWYLDKYPNAIDDATEKTYQMVLNFKDVIDKIDKNMVREWVEDLVITKTAHGLIYQEYILKYFADKNGETWRLATSEEESKGIDGYIGDKPVQIKPHTYLSKMGLNESISYDIIFYKTTNNYLNVYFDE